MTTRESKGLRQVLESRVIELNTAARRRDGIVVECSADDLDRALEAAGRDMAVRTLEFQSAKLHARKAALKRIDDGTYGICQECGEKINPKRLGAMPTAALCLACQEAEDILNPRFGRRLPIAA